MEHSKAKTLDKIWNVSISIYFTYSKPTDFFENIDDS